MDVEKLIFDMYKNEVLISKRFKNEIIKKFGVSSVTAGDIFAKIQNYQIKTFGERLQYGKDKTSYNEMLYKSLLARTRKRAKKVKYYEEQRKIKRMEKSDGTGIIRNN